VLSILSGVLVYLMSMIIFIINPDAFWESFIIGFALCSSRLVFDVIVATRSRVQKAQLKKECTEMTKERRELKIRKLKEHKATNEKLEATERSLESIRLQLNGRGIFVVAQPQRQDFSFKPSLNYDHSIDTEAGSPLVYDSRTETLILAANCQVCKAIILDK